MAVDGFGLKDSVGNEMTCYRMPRSRQTMKENIPTVRNLIAAKAKDNVCIFSERRVHESAKCFKANKISYLDLKDFLKSKRACFNCLSIGHDTRTC